MASQISPIKINNRRAGLTPTMVSTLVVFGILAALVLRTGRRDYADMHIMLDTGMFLLPGLLALLFWEMGRRIESHFQKLLAFSFAFTSVLGFLHALVGVEWPMEFTARDQIQNVLRPTTWPPQAHLLPIGVGVAIWMLHRQVKRAWTQFLLLALLTVLLLIVFRRLPLYTEPLVLGISRPSLGLAPFLWCTVGWAAWRLRASERLMMPLAVMSAVLFVANVAMLYSSEPHDSLAIVAHLGLVFGYLLLLLAVMQMASRDMRERLRVEKDLALLNRDLEGRVLRRTDELKTINESLATEIAERRQTEDALRESQARLESTLSGGGIGTWIFDIATNNAWLDDSLLQILGRSRNDVEHPKGFYQFVHPEDREKARLFFESARQAGANHQSEFRYVRSDGTIVWLESRGRPDHDDGTSSRMIGCILDVTERKQAEEAQLRLAAIVESSDDAIVSKTVDGVITSWNRAAEKLFGYSVVQAVGQPIMMLIPPERAQEETTILNKIARGESVDHFETVRITKSGRRIDVSSSISPLRNSRGEIIGASKIVRDITLKKQAESKLQAQLVRLDLLQQITRSIGERQDLRSILQVVIRRLEDDLPVDFGCVCLYDPITQLLTVTSVGVRSQDLATQMAMVEQSSVAIDENGLGRCVRGQLVYEPDIRPTLFPFPQRLASADLRSLVIAPLLVESKTFGVLIAARKEANSFSSGECEFLRQLSEHVALAAHQGQLYSALEQAYEDLRNTQQAVMQQERLRAVGQMASGIAHDINNALAPMSLYVESILENEPKLSERSRDSLKIVERAIDDVAATVARLREFYRPREPQMTQFPIDLIVLATQAIELTRARWRDIAQHEGARIELVTDLSSETPVIMGAENEIREALTNLIFNALDAMPNGGTLTLRTREADRPLDFAFASSDRYVCLEVSDTGIGMDEETRRRCLEPFFTTKGERGTGLGLAMVYGMAERHSANVEIESAPGEGTTVRLTFIAPTASTLQSTPASSTPNALNCKRLLIIDDDPIVLKSLQDALESDGHVVVAASGGQEGIEIFREACESDESFSVVFTDLGMPYLDGRQVATAIKQASPTTPIVLLTGWGQRLVAEGEIPPHVDRVLNKPPKLRELREALSSLCKNLPENKT
ncbi:MAG: PAS domain S-box protein [Pyrinomonadaceae bacterium]